MSRAAESGTPPLSGNNISVCIEIASSCSKSASQPVGSGESTCSYFRPVLPLSETPRPAHSARRQFVQAQQPESTSGCRLEGACIGAFRLTALSPPLDPAQSAVHVCPRDRWHTELAFPKGECKALTNLGLPATETSALLTASSTRQASSSQLFLSPFPFLSTFFNG